ncbi:hypothetical protein HPB50_022927 [Hyalomma asiaticum]|uniref:Uncharacterized protein n=1 Tax=Hyalomma asiaticum TaxID=266040 RepID=A0ACB7T3C7_HYAAI|nr:hypothetical protein HPB50_022927 [Hyalomma asiaticum]
MLVANWKVITITEVTLGGSHKMYDLKTTPNSTRHRRAESRERYAGCVVCMQQSKPRISAMDMKNLRARKYPRLRRVGTTGHGCSEPGSNKRTDRMMWQNHQNQNLKSVRKP